MRREVGSRGSDGEERRAKEEEGAMGERRESESRHQAESAVKKKKKKKRKGRKGEDKQDGLLARELEFGLLASLTRQQQQQQHGNQHDARRARPPQERRPDPNAERQRLQEAVDRKMRTTEMLHGRLRGLGIKIKAMEQRILEEKRAKRDRGGVRATLEQHLKVQATCKVLKAELDRVVTRSSKVQAANHALVRGINEKRKERQIFESMQTKLRKSFQEKQKQMGRLLKASNELNESRLRAEADLQKVIDENEEEEERVAEEHRELEDVIRKQENLQNEMQTASLKRRANQLQAQLGSGTLDPEEEARLKARLQALNTKIERKSNEIDTVTREAIWNYEEAFARVTKAASEASGGKQLTLADIVARYVQNYDEAFSLLSYVQQVQDENYKLESSLSALRSEFQKYAREQGKNEMNKERIKNELHGRLDNLRASNSKIQASVAAKEATLSSLIQSIDRIAKHFNGRGMALPADATADAESESNSIMHTLGQIELRTIEMTKRIQRRLLAQQAEEEKQRSRLAGLDGFKSQRSSSNFLRSPNSSPSLLELHGGPASPVRSRRQAAVKIPAFNQGDVDTIFDVKTSEGAEAAEEPDAMRVISTEELREMVLMSFSKAGPEGAASPTQASPAASPAASPTLNEDMRRRTSAFFTQ